MHSHSKQSSKQQQPLTAPTLSSLSLSLSLLSLSLSQLEEDAMMVMQSYEKCQKELEEKVEELKSMQTKYEDFKAVVAKVRTVEVEMEAQMEDYVRAAKDNAGGGGDHETPEKIIQTLLTVSRLRDTITI